MRYLTAKDKRRRVLFGKTEFDQFIFRILYNNKKFGKDNANFVSKTKLYYKMAKKDQFLNRVRNRCVVSGKAGWIFSRLKVSRMQFREMFGKGYFYGLRRSSW